jgi:ABC-2 type transport system permease protein
MLMWGFLQTYLNTQSGFLARASGTLIGAILLWDILIRGQLGLSVSFLEEMWSRNIANLFISPLRPGEFLIALMAMSFIRLVAGVVPVTLLAIWFFGFNLWSLGLALGAFFANLLLTAWAVGTIVSGLILRNGMGAENLAWTLMFLVMPVTAVFYPVSVLPGFIQPIAWALPPTYVFEGLRAILIDHTFRADLMVEALVINAGLIIIACAVFLRLIDSARRIGSLMAVGE